MSTESEKARCSGVMPSQNIRRAIHSGSSLLALLAAIRMGSSSVSRIRLPWGGTLQATQMIRRTRSG
jgi:hypothetical protein